MKRVILRNWMAAALLLGACCGLVACDDDNDGPAEPDVTAVQGNFKGEMSIVEAAPTEGEEETPAGTAVTATVSADKILFEEFPVRELIVKVVGDETLADQILAQIGQVDYAVPYTAVMSDDKATIQMTLKPEALKLTLSDDSDSSEDGDGASETDGEDSEGPTGIEIEVTVTAEAGSTYTLASMELAFTLAATAVKLDGTEFPGFEPITLSFDMTKE